MSTAADSLPRAHRRLLRSGLSRVLSYRSELEHLDDAGLRAAADAIRGMIDQSEPGWMEYPFALTCVAARRALQMDPYDTQILAALAIAHGTLAEVRTGEGKTLLATLPAAAFALAGAKVHVMTANEYLASRDADWMRPVFAQLGLTVGAVDAHPSPWRRQEAYAADICYGTASQFGFDYLNDHLVLDASRRAQRGHDVAIVDEADALLLDDARTPLIISGPPGDGSQLREVTEFVAGLDPACVDVDLETRTALLNDAGFDVAEERFATTLTDDPQLLAELYAALKARFCYRRDKEYIVQNGAVHIVDESTGRTQEDRRWQYGLHEAIEAKEGLEVKLPASTLGSITVPAYLALYGHVGAMSGTAAADREEFGDTYGLHVVEIPTHRPSRRVDADDLLFVHAGAKFAALLEAIVSRSAAGQPVLVGAPTVADAERISELLADAGVDHALLTARHPELEADIIAQAGRPGQVTVATNMAGRGVDILLGGDAEKYAATTGEDLSSVRAAFALDRAAVIEAGGLAVLATARHASRRVDDQLRGRSGRQGEPGFSQFYLSLDDEMLEIFSTPMARTLVARAASDQNAPISHRTVSRLIATAQDKLESTHREARRSTNEFAASVVEQQRVVYAWRDRLLDDAPLAAVESVLAVAFRRLLAAEAARDEFDEFEALDVAEDGIDTAGEIEPRGAATSAQPEQGRAVDRDEIVLSFSDDLVIDWYTDEVKNELATTADPTRLAGWCIEAFAARNAHVDADLASVLRSIMLSRLDALWVRHLDTLDAIRDAARLRAAAQRDPRVEFVRDASEHFEKILDEFFTDAGRLVSCGLLRPAAPAPTPA